MSNLIINSITDDEVLSMDSVRYIYSKSKNNFMLVADKEKNIYLAKITDISYKNISKNSDDFSLYKKQANEKVYGNMQTYGEGYESLEGTISRMRRVKF